MRVITGSAKGAKLVSIESMETRPTLDRIKETMFNMLGDSFYEKEVLDIFSGSGALGIEALSRGAAHCEFVDQNIECVKVIKENLIHTKLQDKANINNTEVNKALLLFTKRKKFDIIFMDPPYNKNLANEAIRQILDLELLKEDGIIVAECGDKEKVEIEEVEIIKDRTFKKMSLYILGKK